MSADEPIKESKSVTKSDSVTEEKDPVKQTVEDVPMAASEQSGVDTESSVKIGDEKEPIEKTTPSEETQQMDDRLTGSEEEEIAFLEGYAPAEEDEKDWQHITTDSDAGSDYSTLTEGSASSDNILSMENQAQLDEIAKKTQAKLEERGKKRKYDQRKKFRHGGVKKPPFKKKNKRGKNCPSYLKRKKEWFQKFKTWRREKSGIICIGDVPHGFYEKQMKRFFRQFGEVDRCRVARNRRGKSRHFAYVEFLDPEVAQIVAEAMDGYLLFKSKLNVRVVPREKVWPKLFRGWGPEGDNTEWHQKRRQELFEKMKKRPFSVLNEREKKRSKKAQDKLKEMGIDYDFPEFVVAGPENL